MQRLCGLMLVVTSVFFLVSCSKNEGGAPMEMSARSEAQHVLYYTCGMHPSVHVSPEEYAKGSVNCPICNMKLVPVYREAQEKDGAQEEAAAYYGCGMEGEEHVFSVEGKYLQKCPICGMPLKKLTKQEADSLSGVVSSVRIKGEQARLAGVVTEPVKRMHLFKKIRTIGKVAYDPQLAVAQEEFVSGLSAMDAMEGSSIPEIKGRARSIVESSRRKLRLLGLSESQIDQLEQAREVQENLLLPSDKMWIYGDVYEYELSWVKEGQEISVTTQSLPGEEFHGVIASVNPVLDPMTRSVRFRAEVENPGLKLKPGLYVDVVVRSMYVSPDGEHMVLAIPQNALLDTGLRKIVWVDKGNGEYVGKEVQVGPEARTEEGDHEIAVYPVLKGLIEGEEVVTKANFLIDSQSQITGVAGSAYGGALNTGEKPETAPAHQHR